MKPVHARTLFTRTARRVWLLLARVMPAISVTLLPAPPVLAADAARPNILFIFTDDQSDRTLSCSENAYPFAETPHIDRLAHSGVRFTQAYIGAKCVPSRATMLTGRLQFNVGAGCDRYWAEDFRNQGYTTAMIGKWHWGKGTPMHQHGRAWDWSVVWDHGQKHEHTTYYWGQSVNIDGASATPLGGYSTDRYTDYAVDFISSQCEETHPWYLWLCYGAVHGPYTPAERHTGLYADEAVTPIPRDVFGPRPGKPAHMQLFTKWHEEHGVPTYAGRSLDSWVKQYNEAVRAIDDGVGRIYETLARTGQLDNTVIVFTSDQGFAWGEHGLRDKRYPYTAALRSPLIVSNPARFAENAVCTVPVNGPDLARTLHAVAGVSPAIPLDGRDFATLLNDPRHDRSWSPEPMLQAYTCGRYSSAEIGRAIADDDWEQLTFDNSPAWLMLHDGRLKYTRYLAADCIEELYDVASDPDELTNLAVAPAWHTRLETLRQQAADAFREKGAAFIDLLPHPRVLP